MKRKLSTVLSTCVFISFLAANILTALFFIILYVTGRMKDFRLAYVVMISILLLCSTIIGTAASLPLTRYVLHPLENLRTAMEKVTGGDYNATVEPTKLHVGEESTIGRLENSFNRMTAELRNNELFRKDFISSFSHEFKTPIFSIKGIAKQLYAGEVPEEQQSEFLKIIYEEAAKLADLSDEVLLLTRLEKQEIIPDKAPFSLDEQLRRCMLLFEESWSRKELDVEMVLADITYCSNADLIAHVWNNLFGNAIKFTPPKGGITVTATQDDKSVLVTVADTGIGMTPQTQARIFDRFYQGDLSHTCPGNGLGLTLVKRILDMTGGDISVESAPGCGSVFTVRLPK